MIWKNLKENKCPQCNKLFDTASFSKKLGYIVSQCGFTISNKRYSEIVSSQVNQDLEDRLNKEFQGGGEE